MANSFSSDFNQSVFAIYQDSGCQSYLYSVKALLTNLHGAKSMVWVDVDQTGDHAPGEAFTDTQLSQDGDADGRSARLTQVVVISLIGAAIFIGLGIYLCFLDNRRNQKRGGFVPKPSSQNRSLYPYGSQRHSAGSAASSVPYLPPYDVETYSKPGTMEHGNAVTPPKEAHTATPPSQKIALSSSRYEMPTTRSTSYSSLTNQVGTGAGLDPGSVQQGRNAGFGLGYDLEESTKRSSWRYSDVSLRDAIMTPPHSPGLRPSSVISDDNGQMFGGGI
ncbi:hypothetical protein BGZ58_010084 [Dissophora ornata]|nr:hypothetical protein BGZ58_010084 [Dissophora ornata]